LYAPDVGSFIEGRTCVYGTVDVTEVHVVPAQKLLPIETKAKLYVVVYGRGGPKIDGNSIDRLMAQGTESSLAGGQ